jgi:hypothetical protein
MLLPEPILMAHFLNPKFLSLYLCVLYFQNKNSRTFPIESFPHDSGSALVRSEYGFPKGFPNTNS